MWTTILIGLRNLNRRRLRTILTASMIVLGTAMVVWSQGMIEGGFSDMIALATRSFSGHFQVVKGDYHDKPSLFKTVDRPASIIDRLSGNRYVEAVTARVETAGLMAAGERTVGVTLIGVDPRTEPTVTTLDRALSRGEWLPAPGMGGGEEAGEGHLPIIIGSGVAARLKTGLGDEVSFIGQAADGSIAAELFTVRGIVTTGNDGLDRVLTLVSLTDAQELLVLGDRVHRLVGAATELHRLGRVEAASGLGGQNGDGVRFMGWERILPDLAGGMASKKGGMWVFSCIILITVLLGVSNTMMMSVMERTREFGVMMALGASPGRLMAVVLIEAAWVTALGTAGGLTIGVLANLATAYWGIPYPQGSVSFGGVVITEMTAANGFTGTVIFPALVMLSGLAAGLLPAWRVARLKPALAIREV